jgi:hypothetical protein
MIDEIRRKKATEVSDSDDFPAYSARLRDLLLPEKFKPLEITKYDAKQDPVQWLRCYALSIENSGGNNDTKCLYFLFCLDQSTSGTSSWLSSLATLRAPWGAPVPTWTWRWSSKSKARL